MTTKQPTEPGWDANGSPVEGRLLIETNGRVYQVENGEVVAEWAANERRLHLAKPVPYTEPYDCGSGL